MKCPSCGGRTLVTDSRNPATSPVKRRTRRCESCGDRFRSYEVIVADGDALVVRPRRGSDSNSIDRLERVCLIGTIPLYRIRPLRHEQEECFYCFGFQRDLCPVCKQQGPPGGT